MIANLRELNDIINAVANRALDIVAENSTSGQRYIEHSDVADLIDQEDFVKYADLIADELSSRSEVLEPVTLDDGQLDINIGLSYCKAYQWCEGDKEVFGCSFEEWLEMEPDPISHPLSLTRMAEIGESAVAYILESQPDRAVEELTECIGLSMAEADELCSDAHLGKSRSFTYQLMDVANEKSFIFDNFQEAFQAYKDLGNSELKHLSVLLPEHSPWEGSFGILQQQNGKDTLLNVNMALEHIQKKRIYFENTEIENAFALAEAYVRKQNSIEFYVSSGSFEEPKTFSDFESALAEYKNVPYGFEKDISFTAFDGHARGSGAILLINSGVGYDRPCRIGKDALENPHIALAHAKAIISCYPFDEKAWNMRDEAEKKLGIKDREVDISNDLLVGSWRVHIVPTGGHYGRYNRFVNEGKPIVEFYDMNTIDPKHCPNGQFTGASYYVDTILENNDFRYGLSLNTDCPEWTVSARDMKEVVSYLKGFQQQEISKTSLNDKINMVQQKQKISSDKNPLYKEPER